MDAMEFDEAHSNINDLISDLTPYTNRNYGEDSGDEEEED
jgi:hypothetical protein